MGPSCPALGLHPFLPRPCFSILWEGRSCTCTHLACTHPWGQAAPTHSPDHLFLRQCLCAWHCLSLWVRG